MIEYVLALLAILVVVGVFGYLVTAAIESSERTTSMTRSDYP